MVLFIVFGYCSFMAEKSYAENPAGMESIKQAVEEASPLEAVKLLNEARLSAWSKCPLTATKSLLVSQKASGFGIYQARPNNKYRSGEPVLLYVQPIGYTYKKQGAQYQFGLTADFTFLTEGGDVLAGKRGFGNWVMTSHERNTEFFMNLTYTLSGVKPGNYIIETILNDKFSDKTTKIRTPVIIE
jgi:hypothetical protein